MSRPIAVFIAAIIVIVIAFVVVTFAMNQSVIEAQQKARAPYQTVERMLNDITPTSP